MGTFEVLEDKGKNNVFARRCPLRPMDKQVILHRGERLDEKTFLFTVICLSIIEYFKQRLSELRFLATEMHAWTYNKSSFIPCAYTDEFSRSF